MAPDQKRHISLIAPWIALWGLDLDGDAFVTPFGSCLAPVRYRGRPAMLKLAGHAEERDGARLMTWWAGDGAAAVLAIEGDALLLERAEGSGDLTRLARGGLETRATSILCRAAERLHRPRPGVWPASLRPLASWFSALGPAASAHGGLFAAAEGEARTLLASPDEPRPLHGDLHHGNVLDFGERGWLAIDPKGLVGDRGYDYANLFCNPWPEAAEPARFSARLEQVSAVSGLSQTRLKSWILAYAGLSAAWTLGSGGDPSPALRIGAMAAGVD